MAPSSAPTISCPADVHVEAAGGQTPFPVSYPSPTIVGGKPPVSETCTPPSGQPFDLGTTTVSCHGIDADAREAVCTFTVIVEPPAPQLSFTTFMAFGDSLTEGKVSMIPELTLPASYTLKLADMLRGRYYDQQIDVINEGLGGRKAVEDIDRGMTLGTGHPMGPFTLLDFVGLDTTYKIAEIMYAEYRDRRYAPPPLLKRMVLAGMFGRKSGRGFYDYSQDPPRVSELGL